MRIKEYGYEYDAEINAELYEKTLGKSTFETIDGAYALRSGRDALKAIAREFKPSIVLLPALSCDSMILPFEMHGHNVTYYKLNKNLQIDIRYLKDLLMHNNDVTILFLYMDYFGIKVISDNTLFEIQKNYSNVVFINDITHVFFAPKQLDKFKPDFKVASLRKWINVPDGGLLWCKNDLVNKSFKEDTSFAYMRLQAQQMRNQFFRTGDYSLKTKYRSIFSAVSNIIDNDTEPARMTQYSFELLKIEDFKMLFEQRKRNAETLIKVLSACSKVRVLQENVDASNLYVPFVVDDRNTIQNKLNALGIFNTIIWPIRDVQKKVCENAKYIEEHILAAPCDQRYSIADMEYIGKEITRTVNE